MAYRNREEEKLERREEQAKREAQGGGAEPGERQKKSWREIDAGRDGTRQRSGSRDERGPRGKGESPAYRNYKSRLDKLFDGAVKAASAEPSSAPVMAGRGPVVESVRGAGGREALPKTGGSPAVARDNAARAESLTAAMRAVSATADTTALAPKDRLKQATAADEVEAAARACLAAGGFPNDSEAVAKVLELGDEALVLEALEALLDGMERGRPRNAKALKEAALRLEARLQDPTTLELARGLRARLGG